MRSSALLAVPGSVAPIDADASERLRERGRVGLGNAPAGEPLGGDGQQDGLLLGAQGAPRVHEIARDSSAGVNLNVSI